MHPFAKEAEEAANARARGWSTFCRRSRREACKGSCHHWRHSRRAIPATKSSADQMRAIIAGAFDLMPISLTALYLAGLKRLGCGARQIVEAQSKVSRPIPFPPQMHVWHSREEGVIDLLLTGTCHRQPPTPELCSVSGLPGVKSCRQVPELSDFSDSSGTREKLTGRMPGG